MARVVYDPDELAAIFQGTELEGLPMVAGAGGTVLVEGISPDRRLVSWQAARDAVAGTGRWPVLTLPSHVHHAPEPAELSRLRRAARTMNPWTVFRRLPDWEPLDEEYVARYVSTFSGPEWVPSALRDLSPPTTDMRLEWWMYDTILANPTLSTRSDEPPQDVTATFDAWWRCHPEMTLVLLPTPQQWLTPAWLYYHGAAGRPKPWAAALFQWQKRWEAELVAAPGTTLHFAVGRPPPPGDEAWKLAGQLNALGGSTSAYQWQIALMVTSARSWHLHDRP